MRVADAKGAMAAIAAATGNIDQAVALTHEILTSQTRRTMFSFDAAKSGRWRTAHRCRGGTCDGGCS